MSTATTEKFVIKSYLKSELAAAYGVSIYTFRKWLQQEELLTTEAEKNAKILNPKQVQLIVEKFGNPL